MTTTVKYITITFLLAGLVAFAIWGSSRWLVNEQSNLTVDASNAEASDQSANTQVTQERIIYRGDPPYLTERPILDGNLFVNHVDNYLLLGGNNIEEIRFSAGTRSGERATAEFQENAIAFLMSEQPYIEFSYQDKFYSLQILSRPYFFTMDFREIPSSSITLSNRFEKM